MKRFSLALMLMLAVAVSVSAQSWKDFLGKAACKVVDGMSSIDTGNAVTDVLDALLENSLTLSNAALEGTWNYEGAACVLESEKALSNIGGSLVAGTLEAKLDDMLSKSGISKDNSSFTFVNDGSCVINVGGYELKGKYELDAKEKVINFTFAYDKLPVKTFVVYELQNLNVVFRADRLISLIKSVALCLSENASGEQLQQLQSITQAVNAIGTLLQNYDGLMIGAKLTKTMQ